MSTLEVPAGQTVRPHNGRVSFAAAALFLMAYLLVSPVAGALGEGELPLPGTAASTVAGYYAANQVAALAGAALQLLSVVGLAMFAGTVRTRGWARVLARTAVAAMVASCLFTVAATVTAGGVADQTVALLRQVGFYAGGVIHVVALGGFALVAGRVLHQRGSIGRGVRALGYVAGSLAVLSVLSVGVYYANALLPLGRVLCMLWAVTVGVSLWRRRR